MPNINVRVMCLCGAIGGGAKGFQKARVRLGNLTAVCELLGSVDVDAAACRDFKHLIGVDATVLDLFDRQQYIDWHGHEPPAGWREATVDDIRRAAQNKRPHIVFTSPPCKGFSGLTSKEKANSTKYRALDRLTTRTVWLAMEAWKDDPPEFFLLENVPLIMSRGRYLLDQITALLEHYGYAVRETVHDCGEIGRLAQSRKRCLLVARHQQKVPPFLYQPRRQPLQAVGSVLGRMRLPGDPAAGPMHRVPNLHWKTWVRLAFVKAGSDWRSLRDLRVSDDGYLTDYALSPARGYYRGVLGVRPWDEATGTAIGASLPSHGTFSVADPRFDASRGDYMQYGVRRWDRPTGALINVKSPGQGQFAVADPRIDVANGPRFNNVYRIVSWDKPRGTVTAGNGPTAGGLAVADPRPPEGPLFSKYAVTQWDGSTGTVIGSDDNGAYGVADPRAPRPNEKLVCQIRSLDGTWHRPFTTLEGAVLQSLIDPEEQLELDGLSDSAWRERIGNAVPPNAAQAIAEVMFRTLLAAWTGESILIDTQPVWVRPVAAAIALPGRPSLSP